MSRQKTLADRSQYVVKANDLIRKTRYMLTTQQQKIVLYAISKIKPDDDINTKYTFSIPEFANACGIKISEGGYYYSDLKQDLDALTTRQWCHMPEGVHMTISWIGDAEIREKDATVTISFNPNLQPYLFDLKEKYTQYRLQNALVFKGKYAIRMYEIMRSYTTQEKLDMGDETEIELTVEEFREQFDLKESYKRWVDLEKYVLKLAVEEINERAEDIHVEYTPMRGHRGRTIEKISFLITPARVGQQVRAHIAKKRKLDHLNIGGGSENENDK